MLSQDSRCHGRHRKDTIIAKKEDSSSKLKAQTLDSSNTAMTISKLCAIIGDLKKTMTPFNVEHIRHIRYSPSAPVIFYLPSLTFEAMNRGVFASIRGL